MYVPPSYKSYYEVPYEWYFGRYSDKRNASIPHKILSPFRYSRCKRKYMSICLNKITVLNQFVQMCESVTK